MVSGTGNASKKKANAKANRRQTIQPNTYSKLPAMKDMAPTPKVPMPSVVTPKAAW